MFASIDTQVEDYGFAHLSAGDLLRAHADSGTPDGDALKAKMQAGEIVDSSVTIRLLMRSIAASSADVVLVDGFPRNLENRDAWEKIAGYDCDFVLFFDCTEAEMEKRLLSRGQGRADDNPETIKKRFATFNESTLPVRQAYEKKGKLKVVSAVASPDEVYKHVEKCFDKWAAKKVVHIAVQKVRARVEADRRGGPLPRLFLSGVREGWLSLSPVASVS